MCGWVGCWDLGGDRTGDQALGDLRIMAGTLKHRGPDDEGLWQEPTAGVSLGFRRLSILDLSPEGHQPMHSHSGRYVILFNGEIYNFDELRHELGGAWRGHSDTEIALEAIERWGLQRAIERFNGMFAIALWDREHRSLSFARDPFGKKPLYYGWAGSVLLFGSELKALRAHPVFAAELNRDAMAEFLRFSYVPGPATIYRTIHKLPAGSFLQFSVPTPGTLPEPTTYWDPRAESQKGSQQTIPFQEATDHLEALLLDATYRRCVADMPLGAFLSGGIDSSLVVALMQRRSAAPVKTFTIGFDEPGFNEAPYAKAIAQHLGTEHTELYVSSTQALNVIPLLPTIYDEPFADPSEIPTYLVSRMTREHVTVALSGDGGDELFGGYDRYRVGEMLMKRFAWIPGPLRQLIAHACRAMPSKAWDLTVTGALGQRWSSTRLRKLGRVLETRDFQTIYRGMMSYWSNPENLVVGAQPYGRFWHEDAMPTELEPVQRMMLMDTLTYLVDDILVKVDRASMASSLEVRNPLLDKRVFAFAWGLPLDFNYIQGQGKRMLKEVLYRHVPKELVERPKMGFGIPLGDWLRGPLRPWAEELLTPSRLQATGLQPLPITQAWHDFLEHREPTQDRLWPVLVLQQWLEAQSGS